MLTAIVLAAAGASNSFVVIDPPPPGADWSCTSMIQRQWNPRVSAGQLMFSSQDWSTRRRDLVWAIGKRGHLVGRSHGLAGGSLEWVTNEGRQRRTLLELNPVAFAQHRGDIYVAGDRAYNAVEGGVIYRLRSRSGGQWQIEPVLKLDEAPLTGHAQGPGWYLVTGRGVIRLNLETLEVTRLHRNNQWWQLAPSSIVEHRGRWYIGAVRGVVRLTPDSDGYREQWIVPSDCKTFVGDCKCSP